MSINPIHSSLLSGKSTTSLLLVFIAAGLAGNFFKYPIFLNIDFLFGSIFALLALQFFGIARGIPAACIIASYTYVLWNHPYAVIIMTAEVAVVGWLTERRKVGLVLADLLYWLIIGMPLVYLFYHVVMHAPLSSSFITMTKQAVNGIFNALVARLLFTGYTLSKRTILVSYREIIYTLLASFVLFPAIIMLMVSSIADFTDTDLGIKNSLIENIEHERLNLNNWGKSRSRVIANLAEIAAQKPPRETQVFLEHTLKSDANFLRIGLIDKDAVTTAFAPLVDELGQSNIGKSYADRSFIPMLRQTLKPMLSEVAMSKTGIPSPRVAMLSPVVIIGQYGGYVAGILSLEQLKYHLDMSMSVNQTLYTLLDSNGNIIMTNRPDQKVMTPFVRGKGTLTRLDERINQWLPVLPPNTPTSERWKKSFYTTETGIGALDEWKLILEQPVAPFQKALFEKYTDRLIFLLIILIGAFILAEIVSRRIVVSLEELNRISSNLTAKIMHNVSIVWPESNILEINSQVNNFKTTAAALSQQFQEIRAINMSLEERVEERTKTLMNLEQQLIQAQKMEAIGQLAGGVAHDFNNLLQVINTCSFLLIKDLEENGLPTLFAEEISKAGNRGAELTSALLTFSRKQVMAPKVIDINELIENSCKLISRLLAENITLALKCAPEPLRVFADKGQLDQVLMNLITNARDAMPDGGILTVATGRAVIDQNFIAENGYGRVGKYVVFKVTDTGTGIPGDKVMNIFEPFFTTKEQGRGTGLGLSIVYGIIKQHGGFIQVESDEGSGTAFTIYLSENSDSVPELNADETKTSPAQGEETILVVEDDKDVRAALVYTLRHHGYEVIEAEDGRTAVEILRKAGDKIQLVTLDMIMPGQSGKETFHQLREIRPDIPVVFLTGYTEDLNLEEELLDKNLVLLIKPVAALPLTETISRLLAKYPDEAV